MMIDRKKLKRMAIEMFSHNGREYGSLRMQFVFKVIDVVWYGCQISGSAESREYFPHSHAEYKFCILAEEAFLLHRRMSDDAFADAVDLFLRMNADFSMLSKKVMYFYERAIKVSGLDYDAVCYFRNENIKMMRLERAIKRFKKSGKKPNEYEFG